MALLQDLKNAIGYQAQADLVTPVPESGMWSLRQTNRAVPQPTLITETDRDDIGKGIWATQIYPVSWDVTIPWEAYLSSENAAQVIAFALGKVVETAAVPSGASYKITPFDNNIDCFHDVPVTTFVTSIRSCNQDVEDEKFIGVACEDFLIRIQSGPGRANATISSNWVGTGKFTAPSGIVIPPFTPEHLLNAGGTITLSINGNDYITNKRFVSAEIGYKQNIKLDQGYYPGSGSQQGAAIRGRLRRGVPALTLNFVVEYEHDSNELDLFFAQTPGTADIQIDGATIGVGPGKHSLKAHYPKVVFRAVTKGENDNTLTASIECEVLQDTSTGEVVTFTVVTEKPGIAVKAPEAPEAAPAEKKAA